MLPLIIIFYLFAFILSFGVSIVIKALQRANFHYALEDKFIVLHQGIITKQNRNIPYGRIQSVMLHQKVYERILGIASLTFEDFSNGGKSQMSIDGYVSRGKSRREILGFLGNRIRIPGLRKNDAEALKVHILQKIKENPMEDSQSGL